MPRLASATLLAALAVSTLPATAQVSLQPVQEIPLPLQHSYFIGFEIPTAYHPEIGPRLFLFTTQETYSSPLQFNPQLGWQKEFDLTPFNVNLFETSSVAIHPTNENLYYFTGGLSPNRTITFQQSPIAIIANDRIGSLQLVPQSFVLRPPTEPGGTVEVFYSVSGTESTDSPAIYRHTDVSTPWTSVAGPPASSGVGALRFGPDGLLNVIDTESHRIIRYDPDTLAYVSEVALGNTNTDRNTFVITPEGFIFTAFTDGSAGAIYDYVTGEFMGNYGLYNDINPGVGFGGKTSMTFDAATGLVYVLTSNASGESLFIYNSSHLIEPALGEGTLHTFLAGEDRAAALDASSALFLRIDSGSAVQSGAISGSGSVTKTGFGTLVLSADNTYTGDTIINKGTLVAAFTGEKGTFADHGTVTVNYLGTLSVDGESLGSGAGTAAVVLNGGRLVTTSTTGQATTLRNVTMNSGHISRTDNGRFILDGTLTTLANDASALITADLELRDATFDVSAGSTGNGIDLKVTSTLSGDGPLVKNGAGLMHLSGVSTYTGDTLINAGTLRLGGGDHRLPTTTNIYLRDGATLDLGGTTQTVARLGTINARLTGNVLNGTLDTSSPIFLQSGTYTANFTGSGADTRLWIGGDANATVILAGANDRVATGDHNQLIIGHHTTGAAGTVLLANDRALGAHTENTLIYAGTLDLNRQSVTRGNGIVFMSAADGALVNNNITGDAGTEQRVIFGAGVTARVGGAGMLYLNGVLSGAGDLEKIGGGGLFLNNANTYTGRTLITAGTLYLRAWGSLASSAIIVGRDASFDFSAQPGNHFTIGSGRTLGGSGEVNNGRVIFDSGGTLSPGDSEGATGELFIFTSTWNGGASYIWEINDAADPGDFAGVRYDLLSTFGLTIAATAENKFTLKLASFLANGLAGDVANFDASVDTSYTLVSTLGVSDIIGFDADAFTIDTTGFTNDLNGGTWSLSVSERNLNLNFTAAAVPEPAACSALAGAFALAATLLRRRRHR